MKQDAFLVAPEGTDSPLAHELGRALSPAGFVVVTVPAESAVSVVRERGSGEPPVVFISPGLRTASLTRELAAASPFSPLVVLTAGGTSAGGVRPLTQNATRQWPVGDLGSESFREMVAEAARSSRDRRKLRTTLDRMNARILTRPAVDAAEYRKLVVSDRYRAKVLDDAPDAILSLDTRGQVTSWNRAAERLFSVPGERAVGRHIERVAEKLPGLADLVAGALRGEDLSGRALSLAGRDGELVTDVTLSVVRGEAAEPIGVSVIVRDVTERRRAETALRENEERFRQMANTLPQLAWMARPDGWIFWYNDRWYEYTGTTPEDMEGWGWEKVHDPAELPRVVEKWRAAHASGTEWEDTFPLRRHDGEMRWHLSRARPVRDAGGTIVLWVGTNTDVTEERAVAKERETLLESERAARAEAEKTSHLKDEFLATLSHELRTPLNAILGWSQLLRRKPVPGDGAEATADLNEGLSVIERNARVQAQLVADLLDMSRIISGKLRIDVQRVNLSNVVRESVESVKPTAEARSVRLETVVDSHVGPVRGDPARLQQVLWNLLTNAIKFTPKGGKVQVALERVNSHVEVSVTDTGQGIRPEFLPHVFDRFRQADATTTRAHGGLGLGLSIVKSLVELHGGRVRAKSPGEGLGSTFIIELPLMVIHDEPSDGKREHPRHSSPVATAEFACETGMLKGVKVLVVDDEADARNLLRRVLEECSATVIVAASAKEAFELLKAERPDVLVSDIGMPEEDGYDFIRRVRELPASAGGDIPAAALTAFARSEDRRRALLAGYESHTAKPVEPAELVTVVASLVRRSRRVPTG